ncbi:sodium:alanine symporter family protein [Tissierella sp. MSJ-40]|uniref:Sodium:alanine symporter family protein n=1 Tax=Tissierella simiarum TaxID=2841534 RepID=A0ABS6E2K0_9FIRM|nr:sodium:alanine symporter family protein [Tissierella simiarum]MBU5437014.1 sodium:alanine symporter family protein [Tissierella simiarum]
MEGLVNAIVNFSNWLWGIPMLVILVGGGLFLTIYLGFFQFRYFGFIMKQTFGKIFDRSHKGEGTVSPFQAATAALASTIGASNIVGVPVAIAFGGPGAVFWMWITALIGCASKFCEIVLGIKYREKNELNEYVGGPMYYLSKGLKAPWVGTLFAFFLMLEIVPSVATQTVSLVQTAGTIGIPSWATGVIIAVLVGIVVYGGIKRITQVTEKLVPFMATLYVVGAIIIIIINIKNLPGVIAMIFKHAFTPAAAKGGFAGAAIAQAMRWGIARGVYSNEAGMGTAPIAHATAVTDHPARQAMWGVFEIVVDTLIVCTVTALVVLTTGLYETIPAAEAASIPARAFQQLMGNTLGGGIVTLSIFLFVLSTIIVIIFYGEKQAEYLFGIRFSKIMRVVYLVAIFLGAYGGIEFLYNFLDILLATIIIPNMIGLIVMRKEVRELKDEFFRNPNYYPRSNTK